MLLVLSSLLSCLVTLMSEVNSMSRLTQKLVITINHQEIQRWKTPTQPKVMVQFHQSIEDFECNSYSSNIPLKMESSEVCKESQMSTEIVLFGHQSEKASMEIG